ncbi:MAG: bifunctional riboflavin kinase/FAD synthetase [Cypionkella sp.]|nr:bifunctional riboflavin kinase/FAD synthetase [Cypionkella sp.]
MQVFKDWRSVPNDARGASVAMGNFDGVHLGHRAVIDLARPHGPLGVVTFCPHPREFFAQGAPAFRLNSPAARAHELARIGVDRLFELEFNTALAALSPLDFARDVLAGGLGVAHVTVGADFNFGRARAGNAADLAALGARLGFGVTIAGMVGAQGAEVSSTAIRAALTAGDPRAAAQMLGHPHSFEGVVIHGHKRGRELGYPTANMDISGLHLPRFGVYAVRVQVMDGAHKGQYIGAASLGIRPMFGTNAPNFETYIFDFTGDLYGATINVQLIDFLRDEAKFDSLPALLAQMADDCARAREILS